MENTTSLKAKVICVMITFVLSAAIFLAAAWQLSLYNDLKSSCTAEIAGIVDQKSKGRVSSIDPADKRYLSSNSRKKFWIHIKVKPAEDAPGDFRIRTIYADNGPEKVGDLLTIHYSPDDPDKYYISDRVDSYKAAATVAFVLGALVFAGAVLLAVYVYRSEKARKQRELSL